MENIKPGTRILTSDKGRTQLIPGEVVSVYSKNGKPTLDYYNVKLEDGTTKVLKHGTKASPGNFEVAVHEVNLKENYERLFGKMRKEDYMGRRIKEQNDESGLIVKPRTQIDANKIEDLVNDPNFPYTGEWDSEYGTWFFPEAESSYDQLEMDLQEFFDEHDISASFEGV